VGELGDDDFLLQPASQLPVPVAQLQQRQAFFDFFRGKSKPLAIWQAHKFLFQQVFDISTSVYIIGPVLLSHD
jgi:hypothetical protein